MIGTLAAYAAACTGVLALFIGLVWVTITGRWYGAWGRRLARGALGPLTCIALSFALLSENGQLEDQLALVYFVSPLILGFIVFQMTRRWLPLPTR